MEIISLRDLFVKVANNELEDETKFIYDGSYYKYWKNIKQFDKYTDDTYETVEIYDADIFYLKHLDDEVKLLNPAPKKIEKLKSLNTDYYAKEVFYVDLSKEETCLDIQTLKHKINEIIEKINGGENV